MRRITYYIYIYISDECNIPEVEMKTIQIQIQKLKIQAAFCRLVYVF